MATIRGNLFRWRYWAVAVLAHLLLLTLLYYIGPYQVNARRLERQFDASDRLTSQVKTQQRVKDIEKIKSLLEQSSAEASARAADAKVEEQRAQAPEAVDFSPTSLPEKPEELLKQARELSQSIEQIEKENQVEDLAKVLKVSKEEARGQLGQAAPTSSQPPQTAGEAGKDGHAASAASAAQQPPEAAGGTAPGAQAAAEIQRLEEKARDALSRRQAQLNARQNGVQVDVAGPDGDTSAIKQRIVAFLNRDVAQKKGDKKLYGGSQQDIFDRGVGGMPRVDASTMSKGSGRVLGAGGAYANRVYVNNWYVIGPFDGKHGRGMFDNPRHPPEQGVILDAVYRGKENRLLKWQYISKPQYPLTPPDFAEDAVYYGYTELMVDEARDVTMWLGADDDAQVWLNDKQIWAGGNINKGWFWREIYDTRNTYVRDFNLNEVKRDVRLNKGRNKIFFKLSNGPNRTFFSMVLTK